MSRPPIRIANFSAYSGDRPTALAEVMEGDPVDVLIGDYLAEITLAPMALHYRRDPSKGYAETFVEHLRPHLAMIAERGLKVVANAGGFNPAGLADALRADIAACGTDLRVAHVDGDNLLDTLDELRSNGHELEHLDTGRPFSDWGFEPISANAYLGGWGIAAALEAGASIVVTGRVSDASLVAGPSAWWHGWGREDWGRLAGAVTAGHVIECGPHATGANFSGFTQIPGVEHAGYPIAEVAEDGSSVITKHSGAGGAVTVDTVTAQLVYEIQGPRYLNSDVTVHFDSVEVEQAGPDRVRIQPVLGSPPPPTTKVAIFAKVGYQVVQTIFVTAPRVEEKIALLRRQLDELLDDGIDRLEVTQLGAAADNPSSQWAATVTVRVMGTASTPEPLSRSKFPEALDSLYCSSIPGYFLDGGAQRVTKPWARVDYWPALLPATALSHRAVLDDGSALHIDAPATTQAPQQPAHPEPASRTVSLDDRRVELGTIAHARSGDKGGNSNIGVWVSNPAAWDWLRSTLTSEEFRQLVPETKELDIVRHEFPHLNAVHFILRGLLGTGGSSNMRVDQVGKAVGEYLLAKHVSVPEHLL